MCKLHGYHYACGHHVRYRLSRCRGTFTKVRRRRSKHSPDHVIPKLAACIAECYLTISSPSPCGSCLYENFKAQWHTRISEAENAYSEACDQGTKAGLDRYSWGSGGWDGDNNNNDNDNDDDGQDDGGSNGYDDDDDNEGSANNATSCLTEDDTDMATANKKEQCQEQQHRLRGEIQRRRRALHDLRAEFSVESWSVRDRFPTLDRKAYSLPIIQPRFSHASSPLRNEVFPEGIVLREERNGMADDPEGWGHYPTFQAFFVNTYGGGSDGGWVGEAPGLTETSAWDMNMVANINFTNSLANEDHDPTGDESYYTEYNRFNVSADEDTENEEDEKIPVMVYGPEARFPPLMLEEDLFAPGPNATFPLKRHRKAMEITGMPSHSKSNN